MDDESDSDNEESTSDNEESDDEHDQAQESLTAVRSRYQDRDGQGGEGEWLHVLAGPSQFEFKNVVKHNTGRLWPVKNERELNTIS